MHTSTDMSLALSELKPLITAEKFDELDAALKRFGLDFVLSVELLNYCRAQQERDMVIFLTTLNTYNGNSIAQAGLLLACYQSIASAQLNETLKALPSDSVVRRAIEIILQDPKSVNPNIDHSLKGSADDWTLAIELLLDHQREEASVLLALAPQEDPEFASFQMLRKRLQ